MRFPSRTLEWAALGFLPSIRIFMASACLLSIAIPGQAPGPGNRHNLWALVIGVSKYTTAPPLQFAASDAQAFADFLKSPRGGGISEDHLILLLEDQATKMAIDTAFDKIQSIEPGDKVYVYLAGHGFTTPTGIGYFQPIDGVQETPGATSVRFSFIKETVETGLSLAGQRVLITDVCNAGRFRPEQSELSREIQNLILQHFSTIQGKKGSFLNLLASQPNQNSYELDEFGKGVFSHTLLEALNGEAGGSQSAVVQAKEVVDYVRKKVPVYTHNQQHPMVNSDFDPALPLSYLDRPGPAMSPHVLLTSLLILNVNRTPYARVEWVDPKSQAKAVRLLSGNRESVEIGSLQPGDFECRFYDKENRPRNVRLTLQSGQNKFDLTASGLRTVPRASNAPVQVAFLAPMVPAPAPQGSADSADAALTLKLEGGTAVYVDGAYFGDGEGTDRPVELRGLSPGSHVLRLVPSPEREHRFRIRLFAGQHSFDVGNGDLRFLHAAQIPPSRTAIPAEIPAGSQDAYRRFIQALWEDRLVIPSGDSAWDYYQQLRSAVAPSLEASLRNRLIVAMGNRAQKIILKYLRGGDIRWNAATFEEGALLIQRVQQLFKSSPLYMAQESFFTGRALIERERYSEAVPYLERAIQLDPEASHAYNAIGLALWKQNRLDEAVRPLEQALNLSPRWNYPRNTLALIRVEQRRYQDAETIFRAAIRENEADSTAHHGLGQLFSLVGRIAEAEPAVRRAIDLDPGNAYAHATLGKLLQILRRPQEAEEMLRLAIRLEPDEPSFHVSLGDLLRQEQRREEANQLFARAINRYPSDLEIVRAYASLLAEQKQIEAAEKVFARAIQSAPGDVNLRVVYGSFLRTRGMAAKAERELKRAVQAAPESAFAHYELAEVYVLQKKVGEAERALNAAIRADPRLANPRSLLGTLRFHQKRYEDALAEYKQAANLNIDPSRRQELQELIVQAEAEVIRLGIGEVGRQARTGNTSQAWRSFAEYLKRFPSSPALRDAILEFHAANPVEADSSLLPSTPVSDALRTAFWKELTRAESHWASARTKEAIAQVLGAFEQIKPAERRILLLTPFNLGNADHSIHQIVYRWATRMTDAREYESARRLMDLALEHQIFAVIPNTSPIAIDPLMIRADGSDPKQIGDYEINAHYDRRAHEPLAAAYAGLGQLDAAERYLQGIEVDRPDLPARIRIAKILQKEQKVREAVAFLQPPLQRKEIDAKSRNLPEAFLLLAELQCESGDCASARVTLEAARRLLPKEKSIQDAIKRSRR